MSLKIDNRLVRGVSSLKSEVRDYFARRVSQVPILDFDFDMEGHPKISPEQHRFLESLPTRREVKDVVWACGTDKAPGFNGFNFKFIRGMWDDLEVDI